MSIRNFKANGGAGNQELTFEALDQMAAQLFKQVGRTFTTANDLEKTPDLKLYARFNKTMEDAKKKLKDYMEKLNELRSKEAQHPLEGKVSTCLTNCRKQMEKCEEVAKRLVEPHRLLEEEEEKRKAEEAEKRAKSLAQLEAENQEREANALQQAAGEIVEGMTTLVDLTNQLNDKLDEQHEQIGRIENTIEDARQEMVAGNSDLAEANEHQKAASKCLYIIIGGVVGGLILIAVVAVVLIKVVFKK